LKRYAEDAPILQRRAKEHVRWFGTRAVLEKGRYRKRHPLDCGRARCQLCHGEKIHRRASIKERRAAEALKAELAEF